MSGSYAAIWAYPEVVPHVGRLDLVEQGVYLQDSTPSNRDDTVVPFTAITSVRRATSTERVADLKTLVVELATGRPVRIGVLGVGAGSELLALLVEAINVAGRST